MTGLEWDGLGARLAVARVAVDGGLLVLIWLVQLIIYPSFLWADPDKLVRWHGIYTGRISLVVMPLMLAQVALVVMQVGSKPSLPHFLAAALVGICWLSTFFLSVPLHGRIGAGEIGPDVLQALVDANWPRTVAWTLCFFTAVWPFLWARSPE